MLEVFLYGTLVGHLDTDPDARLRFQYHKAALDEPARWALSVRLPVRAAPYVGREAAAFFENLLAEGDARDLLARSTQTAAGDTLGLLAVFGGECAGAVQCWPAGVPRDPPAYQPSSVTEIAGLFDRRAAERLVRAQTAGHLSMSGVQDKLPVWHVGADYALARHGAPTTALLKRAGDRYDGLVHNEVACCRLMAAAGVPTARASAAAGGTLFESTRFDRELRTDGSVERLHQEDFCQATGRLPVEKYQARGGPALAEIATVLRRESMTPVADLETLVRWAAVNLLLGNNDAHAKNLALLTTPAGRRLAPAYDVLSTLVYPWIAPHLAVPLGGAVNLQSLTAGAVAKWARSVGMTPHGVRELADDAVTRVERALPGVVEDVAGESGPHAVLDELARLVAERVPNLHASLRRRDATKRS